MARFRFNDDSGDESAAVTPFWVRSDYEGHDLVDDRVLAIAKKNWGWAIQLVSKQLHDAPQAPAIVERVAIDVSARLRSSPEVSRNLNAYFRTAVRHRVKSIAARNRRISYQGSTRDLDLVHHPIAPDLNNAFEDRITLEAILPLMSGAARTILQLRLLDYSWKEIATQLHLTEKQAKNRFYYGFRQAYEKHLAAQSQKREERKPSDGE